MQLKIHRLDNWNHHFVRELDCYRAHIKHLQTARLSTGADQQPGIHVSTLTTYSPYSTSV